LRGVGFRLSVAANQEEDNWKKTSGVLEKRLELSSRLSFPFAFRSLSTPGVGFRLLVAFK
jgi:hypothetical protein